MISTTFKMFNEKDLNISLLHGIRPTEQHTKDYDEVNFMPITTSALEEERRKSVDIFLPALLLFLLIEQMVAEVVREGEYVR